MYTKLVDATKSMSTSASMSTLSQANRVTTASLGSIVGRGPAPSRLHEVFIEEKMGLLLYGEYCANLAKSQKRLDDLMLDEQYRPQIVRCETKANQGKFRLKELLSIPLRRVLTYPRLLKVYNVNFNIFSKRSVQIYIIEETE